GTGSFPIEGKNVYDGALAKAGEADSDIDNNSATETTLVLPNPNKAPIISITSPQTGALYVGPTNITINMIATDADGTISKVEVFDNGDLIGEATPLGNGQYVIIKQSASFGNHSLLAVATDNGGRQNISNAANVIVNGSASVSVTTPSAGTLIAPGANVTVSASASHPSGIINKVEFFANGQSIGVGSPGGGQYSVGWNSVTQGIYALVAVATDGSGITTTSAPVTVTVDSPPTVTMTTPSDGSVFPSSTNISVSATAQSAGGAIARVDFYANGLLIGSASDVGTDKFTATWRQVPDAVYSLTAVASDSLGVSTTSPAITIGVNTPSPRPGEFIWFDDALPPGAVKHADGDVDWYWVDANPGAFSGTKSHQSRNLAQLHQHYFDGATTSLPINVGDKLFTYVFLDINNMPGEIMLQWKDANGWEHRAYWGANNITFGTDSTNSRRYMGPLPRTGTWARLEVPASMVGLEGGTLNGMAFTLDGGRASFDLAGKTTANAPPPPATSPGDNVWIEDGLPAGAVTGGVNDVWYWVPGPVYSGATAHQSNGGNKFQSHYFTGAQTPLQVNAGDVLFSYVYLGDPDLTRDPKTPDEIMLQFYDGTSWEHRAFWGENYIGQQNPSSGVQGTESQRFMGGTPAARGWYRLEVPASYVGLEGKSVSGMAFSVYRDKGSPFVTWDRIGKSSQLTTVPLPLSATESVWQLKSSDGHYAYSPNDQGAPGYFPNKKDAFFVHPNQGPGTVPLYRFKRPDPNNNELFYSQSLSYNNNGWVLDGTAFYVFPDATTPGTVPLYLYHNLQTHYLLTTNYNEAISFGTSNLDGIWAYVYPTAGSVPVPPTFLRWNGVVSMVWQDNSLNETGFKIEKASETSPLSWSLVGTVGPNVTSFKTGYGLYRVKAFNAFGESEYSNVACRGCEEYVIMNPPNNTPPMVRITSPVDGAVVDATFAINADAFDVDGNGTIGKVEFFANGMKLGEVTDAPYVFVWNNAAPGNYGLTAMATDNAGAMTTSSPINVTVNKFDQTITFDAISDKTYGDAPFSINAAASSGLQVTFTIVSGPASVSGSTITVTGAGPVTVRASQAGDANYNAAAAVERTFAVAKASATMSLNNLSHIYDGAPKSAVVTTNPTGLSGVSITYSGSSTAPTNAGSYEVVASLTNDNYAATAVTGTLAIAKASQTISFDPLTGRVYGDAPFNINAVATSGLQISFSLVSGPATITGNTITLTGTGIVTVRASQSGNSNYNPAADVTRAFNVLPPQTSSQTFKASTDFSGGQGYRNWYYLDSNGSQMAFDTANNLWQGSETYLQLWSGGGHPGNYLEAVRQWRAPSGGSIRITGNASDAATTCGDGVVASIKRGSQVLWQQTIENGNTSGFAFDITANVAPGDRLNFAINARSACWCDSTNFDPTITFTASATRTYQASSDFSSLQGQRNWYYVDSNGAQMTFEAANNWWHGGETYLLLWGNGGHPGNDTESVRQWRASSGGSIRITGNASDANAGCGDGVIVSIKRNTQLLWQQTIENGDASGFNYDVTTNVGAGDQINFVINPRTLCWCDSTNFDPTIVLTPTDSTSFSGVPINIPGTIQVEDFDNGGEGVAYHDTTAGNAGGQYRTNTDVDIGGSAAGYNLGWTISGEWANYTVNVVTSDVYTIEAQVSGIYCCPNMHVEVDGVNVTGPMSVPNTGGWGAWQTISKPGVIMYAGRHTVRVVIDSPDGFLIDSLRIVPSTTAGP
ncbi:MAG TPA: Ig-like domain-containing protein, partial [Pyrinomonadaceae bacterium]